MKTLFIICFILSASVQYLFGQSNNEYDKDMIELVEKTVNNILSKTKNINVAVWDFTETKNNKGEQNELGEFISQDFSVHFTNMAEGISVLDRDHFKQILSEHEINFEGFIDSSTAKKIGKFTHADAVITGTVDIGYDKLNIRLKVINIETSNQLAASKAYITINEDLRSILKNTDFSGIPSNQPRSNPAEKQNNTRNQDKTYCSKNNTGEFLFKNKMDRKILVDIKGKSVSYKNSLTLNDNQTVRLNNLPQGSYSYKVDINGIRTVGNLGQKRQGNFNVKKCESITYTLSKNGVYSAENEKKTTEYANKNYRVCFKNVGSNRASWGNLRVVLKQNSKTIKKVDISNGSEQCFYNLKLGSVYSYTYKNRLIGEKKGEVLIEKEKNIIYLENH